MIVLVGFAVGSIVGVGLLLAAAGAVGVAPRPPRPERRLPALDRVAARGALAAAAGVALALLTRWPSMVVVGAAGVLIAPTVVGGKARRQQVIDRTEAIAAWAEMLRDTMAAAAGLQAAIAASAKVAPRPIRPQVAQLAAALQREPLPDALAAFADATADPAADVVAVALTVAATRQAGQLGEVLDRAATAARASATMRASIEAGRARSFTSARVIVAVTAGTALLLAVFSRPYLQPFDTPTGQLVMCVISGLFAFGLWYLARLARIDDGPRVLIPAAH